ncbi:unnamed protein product [Nippostrongylus brasiliensis]|uniref:Uncharacterized protein n=1 Tax=Nippostrongylus brasiliensis TaxID=27835 RepID=A0A0N4YHW2_NIPBR|nr:unnamed protein product [Nippostrongylus brasiliensis]
MHVPRRRSKFSYDKGRCVPVGWKPLVVDPRVRNYIYARAKRTCLEARDREAQRRAAEERQRERQQMRERVDVDLEACEAENLRFTVEGSREESYETTTTEEEEEEEEENNEEDRDSASSVEETVGDFQEDDARVLDLAEMRFDGDSLPSIQRRRRKRGETKKGSKSKEKKRRTVKKKGGRRKHKVVYDVPRFQLVFHHQSAMRSPVKRKSAGSSAAEGPMDMFVMRRGVSRGPIARLSLLGAGLEPVADDDSQTCLLRNRFLMKLRVQSTMFYQQLKGRTLDGNELLATIDGLAKSAIRPFKKRLSVEEYKNVMRAVVRECYKKRILDEKTISSKVRKYVDALKNGEQLPSGHHVPKRSDGDDTCKHSVPVKRLKVES